MVNTGFRHRCADIYFRKSKNQHLNLNPRNYLFAVYVRIILDLLIMSLFFT